MHILHGLIYVHHHFRIHIFNVPRQSDPVQTLVSNISVPMRIDQQFRWSAIHINRFCFLNPCMIHPLNNSFVCGASIQRFRGHCNNAMLSREKQGQSTYNVLVPAQFKALMVVLFMLVGGSCQSWTFQNSDATKKTLWGKAPKRS